MPTPTKSAEVLELLCRYEVDFIVVGMTAGVLQGAPAVTFDLGIVYARDSDNVARLLSAPHELEAVFRTDDRRLVPNESHLMSRGHKLLMTKLGGVDVLGALDELEYEDLVPEPAPPPLDSRQGSKQAVREERDRRSSWNVHASYSARVAAGRCDHAHG